jgi:nucleoid-associated protein YgaU
VTKAALIYLAMIVVVTGLITGLPMNLISLGTLEEANASSQGTQPMETVAQKAEKSPVLIPALAPSQDPETAPAVTNVTSTSAQSGGAQSSAASVLAAASQKVVPATEAETRLAKPIVRNGDAGLDLTTASILADLALGEKPQIAPEKQELQAMSSAALTGLRAMRAKKPSTVETTLEALVVQALREGQNDGYIDALVNEAAGKGKIIVPSALVTSDGRVDTAVLLSSLVAQAQVASGAAQTVRPQDIAVGGEGVEVRVVQKATGGSESHQFYTVLPGDSLGAIAVKFYGNVTHYTAIFNANRAILSSPDRLNVGQRLVIPAI